MNCEAVFKVSNHLYEFSPCGQYLASCAHQRLTIRDIYDWESVQEYNCIDNIQACHWSPDSKFILCAIYKKSVTQVWSLDDPSWCCKIDEGSSGLLNSIWSPDSRHVLTTAEFHVRVTVWSLADKSVAYIKHTKAANPSLCFSSSGHYLAVAERRDCKDFISILDCSAWQLLQHIETSTRDLAGISWAPNEDILCVWDTILDYNVSLYTTDGHNLTSYSAYQSALGVRVISWAPNAKLLAIGSYDQKVRLLNNLTWQLIVEFPHPSKIENEIYPDAILYREPEVDKDLFFAEKFEVTTVKPFGVKCAKPDFDKANPKLGICAMKFSHDSRHLATLNENMSSTMWIWSIDQVTLHVIIQFTDTITGFEWDPQGPRLAICTGQSALSIWCDKTRTCSRISCPESANVSITKARWSPSGQKLAASGKDSLVTCRVLPTND